MIIDAIILCAWALAGAGLGVLVTWRRMRRRMRDQWMTAGQGIADRVKLERELKEWRREALCLRAVVGGTCDPRRPQECKCNQPAAVARSYPDPRR